MAFLKSNISKKVDMKSGGTIMEILKTVLLFIQDQILGMEWLGEMIGSLLAGVGMDINARLGGSIQFFLYDVIKITVLLCFLIFAISYIQSYFPPERSKKILGRFHGIGANVVSAQLGTVLAFMMAVTTLSLPSMIMLRKAVKPRLLAVFIAICTAGIIVVGYLFNVFHAMMIL